MDRSVSEKSVGEDRPAQGRIVVGSVAGAIVGEASVPVMVVRG